MAYNMASDSARAAYDLEGTKYKMIADQDEPNGGLWIIKHLNVTESEDQTEATVASWSEPLPAD